MSDKAPDLRVLEPPKRPRSRVRNKPPKRRPPPPKKKTVIEAPTLPKAGVRQAEETWTVYMKRYNAWLKENTELSPADRQAQIKKDWHAQKPAPKAEAKPTPKAEAKPKPRKREGRQRRLKKSATERGRERGLSLEGLPREEQQALAQRELRRRKLQRQLEALELAGRLLLSAAAAEDAAFVLEVRPGAKVELVLQTLVENEESGKLELYGKPVGGSNLANIVQGMRTQIRSLDAE